MATKSKDNRDLFVMDFVQYVSAPQPHTKRVCKIRQTIKSCPSNLTEVQWMKMWRGFYYAIWYAEMRKGGEELIEEMGTFDNPSFYLAGFKALAESWQGIDAFRIDKYMFLIRIMLRSVMKSQIDAILSNSVLFTDNCFMKTFFKNRNGIGFEHKKPKVDPTIEVPILANVIDFILACSNQSVGLFLHISDIYLDELKKYAQDVEESNKSEVYYHLLIPFGKWLALTTDSRIRNSIQDNIFIRLMDEILDEGIDTRIKVLDRFVLPLRDIACHTECGQNRNCLYSLEQRFKQKIVELKSTSSKKLKLKRKIVGFDWKRKKAKYEVVSSTPYALSIVPLPVV